MPDRQCGSCRECCIQPEIDRQPLLQISEVFEAKPEFVPCKYLAESGHGCRLYENRPQTCRDFECAWLLGTVADDEARPDKNGLLVMIQRDPQGRVRLQISECRENAFAERGFALAEDLLRQVSNLDHIYVVFYQSPRRLRYSPHWDHVIVSDGQTNRRMLCSPQSALRSMSHCVGGSIHIGMSMYSETSYVSS